MPSCHTCGFNAFGLVFVLSTATDSTNLVLFCTHSLCSDSNHPVWKAHLHWKPQLKPRCRFALTLRYNLTLQPALHLKLCAGLWAVPASSRWTHGPLYGCAMIFSSLLLETIESQTFKLPKVNLKATIRYRFIWPKL